MSNAIVSLDEKLSKRINQPKFMKKPSDIETMRAYAHPPYELKKKVK